MNTISRVNNKRTKSQVHQSSSKFYLKSQIDKIFKPHDHPMLQLRRCQCCNDRVKYPDYLTEMRKKRIQRLQKKRLAQAFMNSNIPMVESKNQCEQHICQLTPQPTKIITKLSNKVGDYERTPIKSKSILQSFHESIIKSHSSKQYLESPRKQIQSNQRNQIQNQRKSKSEIIDPQNNYKFEVILQNKENGQIFYRSFSAPEYGILALKYIQEIFTKVK